MVRNVEALFDEMDPSPIGEKDLNKDAEDFVVSSAREYPSSRIPVELVPART
ncbi:MAG TPA: hypothetical protein VE007_13700 [Thermoanaerobaculia bacterium]|nr:hypothetical protein [Thermoanaerobaculia bacterium]